MTHYKTRLMIIWEGMVQRCHNPKCRQYKFYGGRGIKVCDRWRVYRNFEADLGMAPSKELSLDRIDNTGDYAPGNVRWATRKEQMRNTRQNRIIEFRGLRKPLAEWAGIIGIHPTTLRKRLQEWSLERALTETSNSR